ncbi:DUF262 domain-containing protein [Roseovarius sp. SYSU LYC5161]|uniref:DUF262 domain-containing protein n=1 Tax=Roseovarius halophilus (ex Wu et al. 2025) TaxID=3376060 RepID=UPI00399AEA90
MLKDVTSPPKAECITFAKFFDTGRAFKIPDYQRAYAWEAEEVEALLGDIDRLADMLEDDANLIHVMGMITCHRSKDESKPYRVVDGQQRLTTLALIHAELSRSAHTKSFLFAPNGNVRLMPQAVDENYFYNTLRGNNGPWKTQGQRNYAAASDTIKKWVNDNTRSPERLKNIVEDGLSLILFTLRDEADVARVFESINNRGRKVTQLDLVKNHLIHLVHTRKWRVNVQDVWSKIAANLAKLDINDEEADRVLRAVVTAQFNPNKRKSRETDAKIVAEKLPVFGSYGEKDRENFQKFLSFLENAFDAYSNLLTANDTSSARMRALTYLRHHGTLRSVLPIIMAHECLSASHAYVSDASVLEVIEKVNFRLYGLPRASRRIRVDSYDVKCSKLAHKYFTKQITSEQLKAELIAIVRSEQSNSVKCIVSSLTIDDGDTFRFDFPSYRKWLRYFLARWEESLLNNQSFNFEKLVGTGPKSNDKLEIEHIWAKEQTDKTVKEYQKGQLIGRLGNLMLIPKGMNVKLSKHLPEIKMEKAEAMNIIKLQQNVDLQHWIKKAVYFVDHLEADSAVAFGENNKAQQKTILKYRNIAMTKILASSRFVWVGCISGYRTTAPDVVS